MQAQNRSSLAGSVLMTTVIFLAIAALTVVSILIATSNYSRISFDAHEYERAFDLADAGVHASIVDLNNGRSGAIDATRSRLFFAVTNGFKAANWGFATTVSNLTASALHIVAVGTYGHATARVLADVQQTAKAQNIHPLYAYAIYVGNSSHSTNYVLQIGGSGTNADFVIGDVYSGNDLAVSGDAKLRMPETFVDVNGNGVYDDGEPWTDSGALSYFSNALSQAEFVAYTSTVNIAQTYGNGHYDPGEAYVDTIGNGVYDPGEAFTDLNGDGVYGFGEPFVDANGDGVFESTEPFVDHGNGVYDSGEPFDDVNGNGVWDAAQPGYYTTVKVGKKKQQVWHDPVPAEPFEDRGNGQYDPGESFVDKNGVYDNGEAFLDDRNGRYDYGSQATGALTGMPGPAAGQMAATGHDVTIAPPDLSKMYYNLPKTSTAPTDATGDWGNDVNVASAPFNGSGQVTAQSNPSHIFVKNPNNRVYTKVPGRNDYFLEDPTDSSYGESHQYLTVQSNGNNKVYFVDGNVYIHNPNSYDFMFRQAGTKMTIVANGNITLSDEFWYNGGKTNPLDSLALIAMKNPAVTNSGNIYLGDAQFGTGGDIDAMLYAENNFVDNNLNTAGQTHLSVFGNMTAGNLVSINRSGSNRTRLDVTLDERIVTRANLPPGLPQALYGQRSIAVTGAWQVVRGTWYTQSPLR